MPTLATSRMRRTLPSSDLRTTCSRSPGVRIAPSARTTSAFSPSESRPAPSLRLLAAIASLMSAMPRPAAASAALSGTTSNVRTRPPSALTSATPGIVRSAGRIVQSSRLRRSSRLRLPPSIVNMNTSDSGVEIGARPPETFDGSSIDDAGQPFGHLLARPIDVGPILEVDGDVGDRILRRRAQDRLLRDPEQLQLDRRDDARLDLLRRHARRLHDDLDLHRGDVGKGVDGDAQERIGAGRRDQCGAEQHEGALCQRELDEPAQHRLLPRPSCFRAGRDRRRQPSRPERDRPRWSRRAASCPSR